MIECWHCCVLLIDETGPGYNEGKCARPEKECKKREEDRGSVVDRGGRQCLGICRPIIIVAQAMGILD